MTGQTKGKTKRPTHPSGATPRVMVPALLDWFAASARDLPWRRTRDPYATWVSEIMLQQTQVKTVIPYWERWMRELPTIESLAGATPETIHKLWEGLGYYTRVRNMQKAAQHLCANHGGRFPDQFDAILALPGIGRYTAGAIASIAFNQPAPILDGNVIRVLARLHGIADDPQEKKTNARLWQLAEELIVAAAQTTQHATRNTEKGIKSKITIKIKRPQSDLAPEVPQPAPFPCSALNQSLMELGALICTPRAPDCATCPIAMHCVAFRDDRVAELPRPRQRAAVTERRFITFVIEHNGRFLVRQRRAGVVNAHLWEFPNWEANGNDSVAAIARTHFNGSHRPLVKLCVVKHSITRYRNSTEAYLLRPGPDPFQTAELAGEWRTLVQLGELAFTSAHRRIATQLEKMLASA